jgi:hypothetical protein
MPISTINIGTIANDGTGDDLREAFIKVNNNFADLDARDPENTSVINRLPDSSTVKGVFYQKVGAELQLKSLESGSNITLTANNDKITIAASGIISLGIVGNTGPVETLVNGNTLQVLGTQTGATRTEMIISGGFPTLRITSLLSNETTPTLNATLNGANNSITGVNVLQASNVQSLVYGLNLDDRDSFIGFDLGDINLDESNQNNITNLLDLFFSVNPVDMGTIAGPSAAVHDFGAI